MYLTLSYPQIMPHVESVGVGLWPIKIKGKWSLIVKTSKEAILTAKVNKGFDIYVAPVQFKDSTSVALVTAFYDDDDEPLTIRTPLLVDDDFTQGLLSVFSKNKFDIFFFDEHNRELLSYQASGNMHLLLEKLETATLLSRDAVHEVLKRAEEWFSIRTTQDDCDATSINLDEPLFRDDFIIMDLDLEKHSFHGSKSFSTTSLEREEPGHYQELDIILLLQRVFKNEQIYLNPIKESDGKEFVDILISGDEAVLLIQAKDSPNIERILRSTIKRKRSKSVAQLKEAATQLKGAVTFTKRNNILRFVDRNAIKEINIGDRQVIGIIIIKELFNDTFNEYDKIAFNFVDESKIPAFFFDYPELARMTFCCNSEDKFLGALYQIWAVAMEKNTFPRLNYPGRPS